MIRMFEVYFDDSGTDGNSEIAIAGCYVSTKRGWDEFTTAWDIVRDEEGFDAFHMADFVAPLHCGHKPFCDWDKPKKDRVYDRIATIINEHKRIGIACAVPKKPYDEIVPNDMKDIYGHEHYTFAVKKCMMQIRQWREESLIKTPMRY